MPGHPPPLYLNPLAAAWRAVNPRTKFPECLEIPGCASDVSADVSPVDAAANAKRVRWNAYQREYQRRRRDALRAATASA
jgi:hypothetical protein